MGVRRTAHRAGSVALTGTPGTGKTSVARHLARRWRVEEVAALASAGRPAPSRRGPTLVDLGRMRRREAHRPRAERPDLYVGHLAHLLPCRAAIVLRCHPVELDRRLRAARRGTDRERRENVAAEATDVVLIEALSLRRRVWEVDTTGRSAARVAREVAALLARRPGPRYGRVDWLADPRVTDYLLRRSR